MPGASSQTTQEMVRALRPIDDAFFLHVADDVGAMEEIVRISLGDSTLVVESTQPQVVMDVVGYRSVTADALCRTGDGRLINVEAQVGSGNDDIRRIRLHLAQLTVTNTPKGAAFSDIPDVAVIYLADYDPLNGGQLSYSVGRVE